MGAQFRRTLIVPSVALLMGYLPGCTLFSDQEVQIRPVERLSGLDTGTQDTNYASAVSAINDRDYARALDYLQGARTKNPEM